MYIGEMSPNSIRGKLQTISWVMQSSGSLFAVTLGLAVQNPPGSSDYNFAWFTQNWWRFVVFLPVVISLIALKMLSDVSETPYILLKRGSREAAMAACEDIYVEEDVEKEFEAVVHSVEISRNKKKPLELMRENREYVHALLVGVCLGFLQNLSGARSLLTSSSRIIVQAGFSARTANFLTFALLGVNVLATVAATFIMDSWGRRKVLIISFTGQALTAIIGAIPFYVSPNADNPVTTVVSLFAFLATYAFGVRDSEERSDENVNNVFTQYCIN
jgi:MFS family permease